MYFHLNNLILKLLNENESLLNLFNAFQNARNQCNEMGSQIQMIIVRNNNFSKIFKQAGTQLEKEKRIKKDYILLNRKMQKELARKQIAFNSDVANIKLFFSMAINFNCT